MNTIKEYLEELERLEKITNEAEEQWTSDPTNRRYEEIFDKAYEEQFYVFLALSQYIECITHGRIHQRDARVMIRQKRNELFSIAP